MSKKLTIEELQTLAGIPMGSATYVVCMQAVFTATVHELEQDPRTGTTRILLGDVHVISGSLDLSEKGRKTLVLSKWNSSMSSDPDVVKYRCHAPKAEVDFVLSGGR